MSSRSLSDIKTRTEGESLICLSDKDLMRMFYRAYKTTLLMNSLAKYCNLKNKHCLGRENQS
jgi:hypothetical protein